MLLWDGGCHLKEKDKFKVNRNNVNFSKDIIYQIVTDRFYNGCPSYNPKGGLDHESRKNKKKYFGGDWIGIIEKLNTNYFTELGVTSLWISQPVENIFTPINDLVGSRLHIMAIGLVILKEQILFLGHLKTFKP